MKSPRIKNKKIRCPMCTETYTTLEALYDHMEEDHEDELPENYSPARYMYYLRTGKTAGRCVVCHVPTEWNERTGKYSRFCTNPKCKEKYKAEFRKRMIGKYGKVNLLKDPEQQKKMLAHRKISGTYTWSDGTKVTYTGSYEKEFLQFLDAFMNFDSSDIMAPSPHTYYYKYEGEELFYIPDFFIPSLNLEIEVKDGGDNMNKHPKIQAVDKVKERLKDEVMNSQKEYDYIKIVNKNYDNFFEYLLAQKANIDVNKDMIKDRPVLENYNDIEGSIVTERLETLITKPLLPSIVTLYHGSSKRYDIIKPTAKNIGTRLSDIRMSSFWCTDINEALLFSIHQVLTDNFNDSMCTLSPDTDNSPMLWISDEHAADALSILKSSKYFVYEKTVEKHWIGRGHNAAAKEYTLDIAVRPDTIHIYTYNDIKQYIKIVPLSRINKLFKDYRNGKIGAYSQHNNIIERLIYYSANEWRDKNKEVMLMQENSQQPLAKCVNRCALMSKYKEQGKDCRTFCDKYRPELEREGEV